MENFMANAGAFPASAQIFSFELTNTRYVHLNIISNHGDNDFVSAGEVAFQSEQVPFEFSKLPAMVFIVAVGGLSYFRNKKGGKG